MFNGEVFNIIIREVNNSYYKDDSNKHTLNRLLKSIINYFTFLNSIKSYSSFSVLRILFIFDLINGYSSIVIVLKILELFNK
jgi:hypothetical protein